MTKKLRTILVVDVEATCWEGEPPPGEQAEIIEIGWAILDVPTGAILQADTLFVKPERSKVSAFCTQLTTLTPEQVGQGVTFADACRFLEDELGARSATWASYGEYDRRQFRRQCEAFGVPYAFGETHLNVKNLFALVHGLPREVGMAAALKILDCPLVGTHHRAGDDARNIAGILASLLSPSRRSRKGKHHAPSTISR